MNSQIVEEIRRFNRFYTNILGVIDQHILDSPYSLAEARVLFEIHHTRECTATQLMTHLKLDKGYLSRILSRLIKNDLIDKKTSPTDARFSYLFLTQKGLALFLELNESSSQQIQSFIQDLTPEDQRILVNSMNKARRILTKSGKPPASIQELKIRHDIQPGDIGYLIYLHGLIYSRECGYNYQFEGYVAHTFHEFIELYHPEKDRLWLAELDDEIVGSIAIVGHPGNLAQLRWFLIHPKARRAGLGKKLLEGALSFCREREYSKVFLLTTSDQQTAIHMYTQAGFRKVTENPVELWGKKMMDLRYELTAP